MRVVVIGAGVAGLALAHALLRNGHEVEVYERSPELRTKGGSITLWPGSTSILREIGIDPGGVRLTTLDAWNPAGRKQFAVDLTQLERRFGAPSIHVARRELTERLAEGIPITYGAKVASVDVDKGEVHFDGGGSALGDVLVGADGRNSVVRNTLWGSDPAELTGWITWQGFIDWPTEPIARSIVGPQGMSGLSPAGPNRQLVWFDLRSAPGQPLWKGDPDALARIRELFGHYQGQTQDVLAAMTELEGFPHVVHKVPKVWGRGPITLVGDAAHSMPPTGAHGTNQALEDVWALSRSITGDLRAYERDRARIANRSSSFAGSEMANKPNPVAGLISDRLATRAYSWLIRRTSGYLLTAS